MREGGNTVGRVAGDTPSTPVPAAKANPEIDPLDALQLLLDLGGLIPGAGAIPDLLNAAISVMRGDFWGALFSAGAAVPLLGDAAGVAKIVKNGEKYLNALRVVETKVLSKLPGPVRRKLEEWIAAVRKELDKLLGKDKPAPAKAEPKAEPKPKEEPKPDTQVKNKRTAEKGKCGEWLAKNDLRDQGFDEILEVQNKSGHGVDVIGRNSQTGEVKVLEVKTTETDRAPPLSKDQREMGGERYTKDRLGKAAGGVGHYKNSPEAIANGRKAQGWLKKAADLGAKVTHEKYDVFIEDPDLGCIKKKAKGSPWLKPK